MNWIEVTDINQLSEIMINRKSILAQDQYGNIGYVYWDSYDWVYDIYDMREEIRLPGKPIKYIIVD